jgi:hypothetical protein
MRILIWLALCAAALFSGAAASAQSWQAETGDDGAMAYGWLRVPGVGFDIACHAPSPQGRGLMEAGWHETNTAPPNQFALRILAGLIPVRTERRADVILQLDQTGYQLPPLQFSEMEGDWQLDLPVSDPMFQHMRQARSMVLHVGQEAAWAFPLAGLGAGLDQLQTFCQGYWSGAVRAPAAAAPASGQVVVPAALPVWVNQQCEGQGTIGPEALQAGDLDHDGRPDFVLDYRGVTCAGSIGNLFCGAANCSIEIFLSTRGYHNPVLALGIGPSLVPLSGGQMGIVIPGTYGLCGAGGCQEVLRWNGREFAPAY